MKNNTQIKPKHVPKWVEVELYSFSIPILRSHQIMVISGILKTDRALGQNVRPQPFAILEHPFLIKSHPHLPECLLEFAMLGALVEFSVPRTEDRLPVLPQGSDQSSHFLTTIDLCEVLTSLSASSTLHPGELKAEQSSLRVIYILKEKFLKIFLDP